jgi:transposase-like protein
MCCKAYRRFSTEFKLGVVEPYLAGEGSLKGLTIMAGVDHSLAHYWLKKQHAGAQCPRPPKHYANQTAAGETCEQHEG